MKEHASLNEQISELVTQKMFHFGEMQRIDRLIDQIRGTNYNIPERAITPIPTQEIAPHPWQAPITTAKWYRRLQPQCNPAQCDSPHFPDDAA